MMLEIGVGKFVTAIIVYTAAINLLTFLAFGYDKRMARLGMRRVSEASLLFFIAIGGGIGSILGQRYFRHKTKKQPFKAQMWTIIAIQLLCFILILTPWV